MIGKVNSYDDNTDAYEIIGENKKKYYGFMYKEEYLNIGETISFEEKKVDLSYEKILYATNITRLEKSYQMKKNKN